MISFKESLVESSSRDTAIARELRWILATLGRSFLTVRFETMALKRVPRRSRQRLPRLVSASCGHTVHVACPGHGHTYTCPARPWLTLLVAVRQRCVSGDNCGARLDSRQARIRRKWVSGPIWARKAEFQGVTCSPASIASEGRGRVSADRPRNLASRPSSSGGSSVFVTSYPTRPYLHIQYGEPSHILSSCENAWSQRRAKRIPPRPRQPECNRILLSCPASRSFRRSGLDTGTVRLYDV
jgi:hypothetical protein